MKYKLADLMPVKANDFIASVNENLWYWTLNVRTKTSHGVAVDNFPFLSMTEWIIPVPGAPEEVRPRKYPDEKPEKEGRYIAHNKYSDEWAKYEYFRNRWHLTDGSMSVWVDIDYFINIPLEE